jgi:hypothetical protein
MLDNFFTETSYILFCLPIGFICALVYTPLIISKSKRDTSILKSKITRYIRLIAFPVMFLFLLLFVSVASSVAINMGLHLLSDKEYGTINLTVKEKRIPYKRSGYYGNVIFQEFSSGTYKIDESTFNRVSIGQKVQADGYSSPYGVELINIELR